VSCCAPVSAGQMNGVLCTQIKTLSVRGSGRASPHPQQSFLSSQEEMALNSEAQEKLNLSST